MNFKEADAIHNGMLQRPRLMQYGRDSENNLIWGLLDGKGGKRIVYFKIYSDLIRIMNLKIHISRPAPASHQWDFRATLSWDFNLSVLG